MHELISSASASAGEPAAFQGPGSPWPALHALPRKTPLMAQSHGAALRN